MRLFVSPNANASIDFPNNLIKYSVFLKDLSECCNDTELHIPDTLNINIEAIKNIIKMCEYYDSVNSVNSKLTEFKKLTEDDLASMTFKEYPTFYKDICTKSDMIAYRELLHAANVLDVAFVRIILYKYLIFLMYAASPRTLLGMSPLSEDKIKEMHKLTRWISNPKK